MPTASRAVHVAAPVPHTCPQPLKCLPGLPSCNACRDAFSYSEKVDAVIYDSDVIPTDWTSADLVQLALAALDQAGISAHSLDNAERHAHGKGIAHTLWHLDLIESCDLCSAAPGEVRAEHAHCGEGEHLLCRKCAGGQS